MNRAAATKKCGEKDWLLFFLLSKTHFHFLFLSLFSPPPLIPGSPERDGGEEEEEGETTREFICHY